MRMKGPLWILSQDKTNNISPYLRVFENALSRICKRVYVPKNYYNSCFTLFPKSTFWCVIRQVLWLGRDNLRRSNMWHLPSRYHNMCRSGVTICGVTTCGVTFRRTRDEAFLSKFQGINSDSLYLLQELLLLTGGGIGQPAMLYEIRYSTITTFVSPSTA